MNCLLAAKQPVCLRGRGGELSEVSIQTFCRFKHFIQIWIAYLPWILFLLIFIALCQRTHLILGTTRFCHHHCQWLSSSTWSSWCSRCCCCWNQFSITGTNFNYAMLALKLWNIRVAFIFCWSFYKMSFNEINQHAGGGGRRESEKKVSGKYCQCAFTG